jgi:hypothetical protein
LKLSLGVIVFEVKQVVGGITNMDVEGVIDVVPFTRTLDANDTPAELLMVRLLNVEAGMVWAPSDELKITVPPQGFELVIGVVVVF